MKIKSVIVLVLLAGLVSACKSTLEPGGSYSPGTTIISTNESGVVVTNFVASAAPNRAFYIADASYDLAYSSIDAAFEFERRNRDALWRLSPSIKRTLDDLRPKAWDVSVRWAKARQVYMLNPTPVGLTDLQRLLSELQNISQAAMATLPSR